MAKVKKKETVSLEEILIPMDEQPYEVPQNWCWSNMSSVAELYTGNSINERVKKEKYLNKSEGLSFIATKDVEFDNSIVYDNGIKINDYDKFKTAPANTSLLCIEGGSAGRKLGFTREKVCFGNKLCAFVDKVCVPKYIYYYLQSNVFYNQFMNQRHGLIGGVSIKELSTIAIPVATLAEQQRIVEQIESLFAKLDETKEKTLESLESFNNRRAAILNKAFRGELTSEWRRKNGVDISSWSNKPFKEFCLLKRGFDLPIQERITGKYPLVTSSGVNDYISDYKVKGPGVITGRSGTIGKVFLVEDDYWPLNTTLYSDKLYDNDPEYVYYFLQTFDFKQYSSSTAVPTLNRNLFSDVLINVPTKEEQIQIVKEIRKLLDSEECIKGLIGNVSNNVDLMKKTILVKAFRGELGTNNPEEESAVELLKQVLVQL